MNENPGIPESPDPDGRRQRLMERFKFRRVNEITGTFVLVIVAVLIAAIIWMGHSQRWFKSRVALRIVLPEAGAAGICQGSEVYFLGTLVGSVSDVEVDAQGRMQAQANIRRDFFLFVRADSSAVIKKKFGVAGDSFFEISRGQGKPLPEQDASIVCNEQFQSALESAIEDIRRETLLALKKTSLGLDTWTQLGTNLDETRKHLDTITAHLENLAAGIEAGKGTVGKLITDPALADEAQTILTQANAAMVVFQGVVTNLDITAMNIRKGTTRLPEINDAVADTARNLPELVRQMQVSTREIQRLTEAMEHHWLIRKYVNQTNPPPSVPPARFIGPLR
jgi:phospholipid/cholesterol/gamma-HCH transport system substrate-binding protein